MSKHLLAPNSYKILALILLLALAARLYKSHAPLVGFHSWRQSDTMAVARNFNSNGYNILLPQVDWGGSTPGYVEMEFPIYQYILSLIFAFTGASEFFARLLSISFSLLTILVFHEVVKRISGERTARWASLFMAILPLTIFMGRAIMPEALLMLSIISAVYFFLRWLDDEGNTDYFLSILFITLACLIKPPSLYMGLPLGYLAWYKYRNKLLVQWKLWGFGITLFLGLFLWYSHAHHIYLISGLTFGIWGYQTNKWGKWWLLATTGYWKTIFVDYLGVFLFAWVGYPIFLWGLALKRRSQREYFFDFWSIGIMVYFLIVNDGNMWHFYYQLPLAFPATYYMAKVFDRYFTTKDYLASAMSTGALALILVSSLVIYDSILMKREDPAQSSTYELAQLIQAHTEPDDLIVSLDGGNPTLLYLAKRKGWDSSLSPDLEQGLGLEQKIAQGADYFAGDFISCAEYGSSTCDDLNQILDRYGAVIKDRKFFIVDLRQ